VVPTRDVLITAGLGDFIALESRWDDAFAASLRSIHWASRAYRPMAPILRRLPEYRHVAHVVTYDHWHHDGGPVVGILDVGHLRGSLKGLGLPAPELPPGLEDWSIIRRFRRGLPFVGSSPLRHDLADLRPIGLPAAYAVVQADTPWNRPAHRAERRMRPRDVAGCLATLDRWGLPGIVLGGAPGEPVAGLEGLRHLDDATPAVAIEILKRADAYCGIDSWLSVLAAQRFGPDRLRILSRNVHLWSHLPDYYAPHERFDFVTRDLGRDS
jgi:hypothetical protein